MQELFKRSGVKDIVGSGDRVVDVELVEGLAGGSALLRGGSFGLFVLRCMYACVCVKMRRVNTGEARSAHCSTCSGVRYNWSGSEAGTQLHGQAEQADARSTVPDWE